MNSVNISRRRLVVALGAGSAAAGLGMPNLVRAQTLPNKPITMIIGFAPGGIADITARLVAPHMSEVLGRQIVVDNRAGASGNIGTQYLAGAKPDGSTLMISSMTQIVVNPNTFAKLPADPINGLSHICMMSQGDFVLAVNGSVPVKTAAEFVALSKKAPGTLNFGTAGAGGVTHVMCELFKLRTGADILSVHYKGSGQMITDLIGGTVHACIDGIPVVEQYTKQGKVRILLVAAKKRNPVFPDAPTASEAGVKDFDSTSNWFGLHAPPGLPDGLKSQLYEAAKVAASKPEVKERFAQLGLESATQIGSDFPALIAAQNKLFGEVTRAANIRAE